MNKFIQKHKKVLIALTACLLVGVVTMSFQNIPFGPIDKLDTLMEVQDTIPEKHTDTDENMSIKEFDKLMNTMENQRLSMEKEVASIDFNKMHREITASLNKIDLDKIKLDIDKAMKQIDFSKIEDGVQSALKEIDWNKLNNDVKLSLQDAKKEIEKVNMETIKREMEKAKAEIEKSKLEIKKINVDEIMKKANESIARAKDELRLTKEMFIEMEKDGLIDQKEGFTIDYQNKTLIINGKKQSEHVRNRYQRYIKGDRFNITISKE